MVAGKYYTGGFRLGNMTLGGSQAGLFQGAFKFQVEPGGQPLPLSVGGERVSAFEWTRLAAPIPTMLPSLNQIGFDYMEWIVAPVFISPVDGNGQARMVLWAIGAKRGANGGLVPDPASDFTLPLNVRTQGADFVAVDQNFPMPITGINIPFNLFELRGTFGPNGVTNHPAAYASTDALSIPTFGPYLVLAGLANNWYKEMLVSGTYVTRSFDGPANHVPAGVHVSGLTFSAPTKEAAGSVVAKFNLDARVAYPVNAHRAGLLLVDTAASSAVYMDYKANLSMQADAAGNLQSVMLNLPAGLVLPAQTQAYVLLDVFPVYQQAIK